MFSEYEPGAYLGFVSPTPLLMVVALRDHLTVADAALAAYERALEPKRLVTLPGGHFDAYVADFDRSEEHTSELPSLMRSSYAVFRLKKKTPTPERPYQIHNSSTVH